MKVVFVLGTSAGGLGRHVRMLAAGCAAQGVTVAVFGPARTDRDFGFSTIAHTAPSPSAPSPSAQGPRGQGPAHGPSAQGPRGQGWSAQGPAEPVTFTAVEIADRPHVVRDLSAIARLCRLLRAAAPAAPLGHHQPTGAPDVVHANSLSAAIPDVADGKRTVAPDVVHAHGLRAGALAAIAIAFGGTRIPLIVTVHNAPPAGGVTGAIYRVLELIVARNAASVLCVSADLEQRMRAAGARRVARAVVPAPPITLTAPSAAPAAAAVHCAPSAAPENVSAETPHAIAPDVSAETRAEIRAELGDLGPGPVVLAVGRLAAQKGFSVLLDAAVRWRDLRPEPSLVIVGEGPLEAELKHQAASLGLAATFTGRRPDVPELLAAAGVFVLPSAWEGQALILQEALRAGVPIVATRVGGNPDLLGEDAAVLVPPGDAAGLAAAVRSVLADPALAARLRLAAMDRARVLPAEDDAVAAVLAEYVHLARREQAVSSGPGPSPIR